MRTQGHLIAPETPQETTHTVFGSIEGFKMHFLWALQILSVISAALVYSAFSEGKNRENVAVMDSFIKSYDPLVSKLESKKELIVMLGDPLAGKSTLSKFLRRDKSLSIKRNEQRELIFADNDATICSSDSFTKHSIYPNINSDEEYGTTIVDLPGLDEPRHAEIDFINTFFTRTIFKTTRQLKIRKRKSTSSGCANLKEMQRKLRKSRGK
ncbi:Hypothetical predicted protein [Cloeon dipterum]|uniref:Uncharacterized protein n=1 Tax=Cloeon dipterum TaxID=197152 RepID=A0A8S1C467_9INSE|nr:Hypothetical predicted protein [Cloeon dipterum]